MGYLVLMNVTNGGNMLDHSPMATWNNIPNRQTVSSVKIMLGQQIYRLRRVDGYHNRGGVNNADVGRWLNAFYGNAQGLTLLFDVSWDLNENTICYKLIGNVDKI